MKIAIYPGSFDPITNGHLDVLNRAMKIFDKVIVLVAVNKNKKSRFSSQERVEMIKEAVDELTAKLDATGYSVTSGPRTTGDGYYESCIVAFEENLIEITE